MVRCDQRLPLGMCRRGAEQVDLPACRKNAADDHGQAQSAEQRTTQQRGTLQDQRVLLAVVGE